MREDDEDREDGEDVGEDEGEAAWGSGSGEIERLLVGLLLGEPRGEE